MSTRANIIVKDAFSELIFYRHSDGYPEGAMPTLEKFMELVKTKKIRDNTGQAAGWLIVLGRAEHAEMLKDYDPKDREYYDSPNGMGWKVGAIEPTDCIHGDIEYLYLVDLEKKTIKHRALDHGPGFEAIIPPKFYSGKYAKKTEGVSV